MVSLIAAADPSARRRLRARRRRRSNRAWPPRARGCMRRSARRARMALALHRGRGSDFGPLLRSGQREPCGTPASATTAWRSRAARSSSRTTPANAGTLTFSVAVSLSPYEEQLWRFRRELLGWFVGLMLALLLTLAALLQLGAGAAAPHGARDPRGGGGAQRDPRRRLSARAVRRGHQPQRAALGERKRVSRYRDTLGNLAHSLKTPLAVMRSSLPAAAALPGARGRDRPHERHHRAPAEARRGLRRGAAGGRRRWRSRTLAADLRAALLKVYASKDLSIELAVAAGSAVHRRPRRSHRAARQPARQRLQVVPRPRAPECQRPIRPRTARQRLTLGRRG